MCDTDDAPRPASTPRTTADSERIAYVPPLVTLKEQARQSGISYRMQKRVERVMRSCPYRIMLELIDKGFVSFRAAEDSLKEDPEIVLEALYAIRDGKVSNLRKALRMIHANR